MGKRGPKPKVPDAVSLAEIERTYNRGFDGLTDGKIRLGIEEVESFLFASGTDREREVVRKLRAVRSDPKDRQRFVREVRSRPTDERTTETKRALLLLQARRPDLAERYDVARLERFAQGVEQDGPYPYPGYDHDGEALLAALIEATRLPPSVTRSRTRETARRRVEIDLEARW